MGLVGVEQWDKATANVSAHGPADKTPQIVCGKKLLKRNDSEDFWPDGRIVLRNNNFGRYLLKARSFKLINFTK